MTFASIPIDRAAWAIAAPSQAILRHTSIPRKYEGIDSLTSDNYLMDLDLTKVELQEVLAAVLRDMVKLLAEHEAYDYFLRLSAGVQSGG